MTFNDAQRTELAKPLDRKYVKPPAPGKYGDYVEGWHVIAEANRIFGFDGWTRETISMIETNRDLVDLTGKNGPYQQWRVGFVAKVKITAGGVTREGTGFGSGMAKPDALGEAIESAVKEAETDAMKRGLMTFGNPFGLALYDKTKANVADAPLAGDDSEYKRAAFALRNASSKADLKAVWDAVAWDTLNETQTGQLMTVKDARLAELNAPKPAKNLGEHLDNLERQANPN